MMRPALAGEGKQSGVVIAIDGPAGVGKTTVARALARELGMPLLDTGAVYRTLALVARRRGVSWDDETGLVALCHAFPIRFGEVHPGDPAQAVQRVLLGDEDLTQDIRTPEISEGASRVSAWPGVRAALLGVQRALGQTPKGCVAEGRDMGTVVFPSAPYKFFLDADLHIRAQRRQGDLEAAGETQTVDRVAADIDRRDKRDSSRAVAPLALAPDAVRVDTSRMDPSRVIEHMLAVVRGRGPLAHRG